MAGQTEPLVITQNGEAKVVMQGIESYEETQQTMALLKILALGMRQIDEGKSCRLRMQLSASVNGVRPCEVV